MSVMAEIVSIDNFNSLPTISYLHNSSYNSISLNIVKTGLKQVFIVILIMTDQACSFGSYYLITQIKVCIKSNGT